MWQKPTQVFWALILHKKNANSDVYFEEYKYPEKTTKSFMPRDIGSYMCIAAYILYIYIYFIVYYLIVWNASCVSHSGMSDSLQPHSVAPRLLCP